MKSGQRAKLGEILERQSVKLQELTARCSKYARHFAKPLCESVKSVDLYPPSNHQQPVRSSLGEGESTINYRVTAK